MPMRNTHPADRLAQVRWLSATASRPAKPPWAKNHPYWPHRGRPRAEPGPIRELPMRSAMLPGVVDISASWGNIGARINGFGAGNALLRNHLRWPVLPCECSLERASKSHARWPSCWWRSTFPQLHKAVPSPSDRPLIVRKQSIP